MTSSPNSGHGPWGEETWNESRPSRVPMVQVWMLSDVWLVRYTPLELLACKTEVIPRMWRKYERTNKRTNERIYERTDEQKSENYIPLGINAGGIINMKMCLCLECISSLIYFECIPFLTGNCSLKCYYAHLPKCYSKIVSFLEY